MELDIELLKKWDLCKVKIQDNIFIGCKRPTTQEDNFGQIYERVDLYEIPHTLNNGILSEMLQGERIKNGHLVIYFDKTFKVWHGRINYKVHAEIS